MIKLRVRLPFRDWSRAVDRGDITAVRERSQRWADQATELLRPRVEEAFNNLIVYGRHPL